MARSICLIRRPALRYLVRREKIESAFGSGEKIMLETEQPIKKIKTTY